jgi:hypothetical protein
MKRAFDKLKKIREMFWSGRADLNRGPPAPKAGALLAPSQNRNTNGGESWQNANER